MKWFGDPWPSAEERAPICGDDGERTVTPVGRRCPYCHEQIRGDDQGVEVPHVTQPPVPGQVVAIHLHCLMGGILPWPGEQ